MRRLALAVLSGALILAACSDASRQGPSDTPAFDKGVPCPDTDFPLEQANALITQLYPAESGGHGKHADDPRGTMLARAHDISEKWSKCKVADPQGKVVDFVADVLSDFNAGNMIGGTSSETAVLVGQLVNVMYAGVGFGTDFPAPPLPDVPTSGPDYGIGFFTPGQQLLVQTSVKDGAVLIPANGFTEPTTITVYLRPDSPNPFDGTGFLVYPPFYEITASNLSGTHYLANGQAVVGFCVDETILNPLADPAIAHLAVAEGTHPGGFEVLSDASDPEFDALELDCERYAPPVVIGSLFDNGVGGFFHHAPSIAAHYLRSAASALLLPTELHASAFFGKYGLGSLASSLSPFGVTDRAVSENHLEISTGPSPSDAHYYVGSVIDACHDSCEPLVTLLNAGDQPVGAGTDVSVTLRQVAGSGGTLTGTTTQTTDGNSTALFNDLRITAPGQYQLIFAAEGAKPDTTGTFDVYQLRFIVQPTANGLATVGAPLGGSFEDYLSPVVVVAAFDFANDTVTTVNDDVTITASAGTLGGTTDVSLLNGTAVFTNLMNVSEVLTGVTLRAHAFFNTLDILATSDPFDVVLPTSE